MGVSFHFYPVLPLYFFTEKSVITISDIFFILYLCP